MPHIAQRKHAFLGKIKGISKKKKLPARKKIAEAPAREEIEVQKHQIDISALSAATGETGLTGGTRESATP